MAEAGASTDKPPQDAGATETTTNPRGIPTAPFVSNVSDYLTSRAEVEPTLTRFQEMIQKYKFMQLNTEKRAASLRDKIPDIRKTLETVRFLQTQTPESGPLETTFELNDTLYAKALVSPQQTREVFLWLGANVMLAYPVAEAEELLRTRLGAAEETLGYCEEDMDFLREQITTMEVATARVYNWDVAARRKEKTEEGGAQDGEEGGKGAGKGQ